uniref:Uncharacterized protein n=1 Tax=Anguilla anguilla TaxID=7936 RepID=A0A0E9RZC0_ANGAN
MCSICKNQAHFYTKTCFKS